MAVSSGARKTLIVIAALVCAFGLLVGFAHWRVHELETGDVAWSEESYGRPDEAIVVRGRVYTYDDDRLAIRDLRTGGRISVRNEIGFQAYVGDGGQVAIQDLTGHRLAFYSRDGKELWHHAGVTGTPAAIGTDGGFDIVECPKDGCHDVHYDAAGRVTARTPVHGPVSPETVGSAVFGAEDRHVLQLPAVPVDLDGRRARELRGGRPSGPAVTADKYGLAQVGDLLVGFSRRGGTCVFAAVRSGEHAWTTSTPCPALAVQRLVVFEHRLYAYNATDSGFDVVSTDLGGAHASSFRIPAATPSKGGRRDLRPTPNALVLVTTGAVAAYSPTSGKRLWEQKLSRNSADVLDTSHRLYPAVEVSGAIIDVNGDTQPPWPQLAIGHHTPSTTHTFLDPATGDTTAELAVPWGAYVSGTDDGSAVVLGDDRVKLVRP